MKKVHMIVIGSLIFLISLFVLSLIKHNHYFQPHFVTNAESRLQSYLSSSFGPTNCETEQYGKQKWKIVCQAKPKDQPFEYLVKNFDGDTSDNGAFSLVALNDRAKINKNTGLLIYLNIN